MIWANMRIGCTVSGFPFLLLFLRAPRNFLISIVRVFVAATTAGTASRFPT